MSPQGQTFVPAAARARLELDSDNDRVPNFFADQYEGRDGLLGLRDPVGPVRLAGRPPIASSWPYGCGNSVSSSGTNVDVWDVNEQLKALIRSRRAVDAVMLVDPDAPLESLVAEEEPSDAR